MERWEIFKELAEWSEKLEKNNLSAEEYRQCEINIFELKTLLKIADKKNMKHGK